MTRACQGISTSFPDAPDVFPPRPPTRARCADRPGARYEGLSRLFINYGRLGRLSEGPPMDGYRYLQPDNATRGGRHCHGIMSYDALGDARQPGARVDLLRLRHYPPSTPSERSSDTRAQA